ncbi:hypothetical protein Dsin_020375 [Dipteronia sinensis]|uniref:Uncharacterized protein n=1 Tax=Dipteronia sinensis TaxID=43782 RepID=A0AAE0A9W2_9ROSI|nr:hypothetical protein Dsin_020375 [Dipteronia sinensis]
MKRGRKNLKRAAEEQSLTVQDGQSVMQVVSLRGSNLIEVIDAQGMRLLIPRCRFNDEESVMERLEKEKEESLDGNHRIVRQIH